MSIESRNLEETKERIKRKQAELFEKRLDLYLMIEDPEIPKNQKRLAFEALLKPQEFKEQENRISQETLPEEEKENEG